MQPFQPASVPPADIERTIAELVAQGLPEHGAREAVMSVFEGTIWLNNEYQVVQRGFGVPDGPAMWHLSIRRLDRAPIRDWRVMQEIKNMLCGPECEGVELYPAESRLVDCANQYHLWVIADSNTRFPFGFDAGRVTDENTGLHLSGAKQRARA